jgi:hypothetical protein
VNFDLRADLRDRCCDYSLVTGTVIDGRVVLGDGDFAGITSVSIVTFSSLTPVPAKSPVHRSG